MSSIRYYFNFTQKLRITIRAINALCFFSFRTISVTSNTVFYYLVAEILLKPKLHSLFKVSVQKLNWFFLELDEFVHHKLLSRWNREEGKSLPKNLFQEAKCVFILRMSKLNFLYEAFINSWNYKYCFNPPRYSRTVNWFVRLNKNLKKWSLSQFCIFFILLEIFIESCYNTQTAIFLKRLKKCRRGNFLSFMLSEAYVYILQT